MVGEVGALAFEGVADGGVEGWLVKEVAGAAFTGPEAGVGRGEVGFAEAAGGPCLELAHDHFGGVVRGGEDAVDVVGAYVEGEDLPAAEAAVVLDRGLHDWAGLVGQEEGSVAELVLSGGEARCRRGDERRLVGVVGVVDRASIVAMEPGAVAGPGEEVGEGGGHGESIPGGRLLAQSALVGSIACAIGSSGRLRPRSS